MNMYTSALRIVIGAIAIIFIWTVALHNQLINYCPSEGDGPPNPAIYALPRPTIYRDPGGTYETTEFPGPSARRIWWFHGRGSRVSTSYWHLGEIYRNCNCTLVAVEGIHCISSWAYNPSEETIIRGHASAINDHRGTPAKQTVLFGVSMGTAHATAVYHRTGADGIILENPFTSISDYLRIIPTPAWRTSDRIRNITVPILLYTSEQDTIVPPFHSDRLASLMQDPIQVYLSNCDHGDTFSHPVYWSVFKQWLDGL